MSNYCKTCEQEVARCWDTESGCSGGGHCMSCMGYNFEDENEEEEREANETLTKALETKENA